METLIIWLIVAVVGLAIFIPYVLSFRKTQAVYAQRKKEAKAMGIDRPRAQFPMINKALCIGCGACVDACPEGDVLGVVWGTAEVINGQRCVGHGLCEKVCPVGALKVGLGDVKSRPDIPILSDHNESSVPGLYIAGELAGLALIRHAISQGRMVVDDIAQKRNAASDPNFPDLIIVGAGPAGVSAALTAIQHGLSYLILDEGEIGGTMLHYPRQKMVMTQPVEIPLYGWLKEDEYSKEYLVDTWQRIAQQFHLNIHTGEKVIDVRRTGKGFEIVSEKNCFQSRYVVLALGRRGMPRKLDAPGENLPKVLYQLIDAQSYRGKHMLVVGGGDSAVEAAVGLARQKGNVVTISYRKSSFFRIKKKNEDAVTQLIRENKIRALFDSQVVEIREGSVVIDATQGRLEIDNDFILVQIGGVPPYEMLKRAGVAFGGNVGSLVESGPVPR